MATATEEVAPPAVAGEAPVPERVAEVKGEELMPQEEEKAPEQETEKEEQKPEQGEKVDDADQGKKAEEKKARKPRSRKPKSAAPQHPPYFEMIKEAILALDGSNGKSGCSQYAIAKYMEEKNRDVLPANFRKVLAVQLRGFAARGRLVKVKASFKLAAAEEKQARAAVVKKTTATAKRKRTPAKKPVAMASAAPREARKARAKRARKAAPAAPAAPQPKPRQPRSVRAAVARKANKASA